MEPDTGREIELDDAVAYLGFALFSPRGDLVIVSSLADGRGVLYSVDGSVVHEFEPEFRETALLSDAELLEFEDSAEIQAAPKVSF